MSEGNADELRAWMGTWDGDVVAKTETWPRDRTGSSMFQGPGAMGKIDREVTEEGELHF